MTMINLALRPARSVDYDTIAAVVDEWWGRPVLHSLPRLFLDHFHGTSVVAERDGRLLGFLVGIISPSAPDQAYIHFVGVHPEARKYGLARTMYEHFFQVARGADRHTVGAITSPVNEGSIAFHRRMGFTVSPRAGHNGPGQDMIVFERAL
jgi:ribosomal protein S18 acetylase RimI-like enzyme